MKTTKAPRAFSYRFATRSQSDPNRRAIESLAHSLGLEPQEILEPSPSTLDWTSREGASAVLQLLQPGDKLLVPHLGVWATITDLVRTIQALTGSGISVHCASLGTGSMASHLPLLIEAAMVAGPIEDEVALQREELATMNERVEARLADQNRQATMLLLERLPALFQDMPKLGSLSQPIEDKGVKLGMAIRKQREALGMTLADVGKQIGVSNATMSRLETTGHSPHLNAVMALLFTPKDASNAV